MSNLVVVADSSRARMLLSESGDSVLSEYKDLVHPESRLREKDLLSDETGNVYDSGGHGIHGMGQENTAHRKETEDFAREICAEVDHLRNKGELRRIYLVAPPKFLGLLRASMSKQSAALVAGEINKELVTHGIDDIRAHLPKRL